MSHDHPPCCSCNTPSEQVIYSRRSGLDLCDTCRQWVLMSLRRTRRLPDWVRPDPNISAHELGKLREQFQKSLQTDTRHARAYLQANINLQMGFSYSGPLSEIGWSTALSIIFTRQRYSVPNIPHSVIDEELDRLEEAGVIRLPRPVSYTHMTLPTKA